ncbi:MAG: protein-L-isoaspartate(D-aspartate) O-methyltransferase [Luteitalea sp.]|nr:protein-L-isoaspartate(D-aspartate) O-methyltransferase [Luteitalea sp.]
MRRWGWLLLATGLVLVAVLVGTNRVWPTGRLQQPASPAAAVDDSAARARMVEAQLRGRDIRDRRVLEAMGRVPRERFVPEPYRDAAYGDSPLPIGYDQTISQPYIVAYMTQAARVDPDDTVLEIGTGSGYQAAVLAEIARTVYSVEIVAPLAERAESTLRQLGYTNVHVRHGDGYLGWPDKAPFDAVLVTAAPDHVPEPLIEQLAIGGRLVVPVGDYEQEMRILTKTRQGVTEERTIPVRFVPLTRKPR